MKMIEVLEARLGEIRKEVLSIVENQSLSLTLKNIQMQPRSKLDLNIRQI